MKLLGYWPSRLFCVEFSFPARFRKRLTFAVPGGKRSGWALKKDGRWFAVYSEGEHLRFQCDDWSCEIKSPLECTLRQTSMGTQLFSVMAKEEVVFRFEYSPPKYGAFVDVTYDSMDSEDDDFFLVALPSLE